MTGSVDSAGAPLRPAANHVRESDPPQRRISLAGLLVAALLLGLIAAALPSIRGISGEEARDLRALGAAVASIVLGCAIGARLGGDVAPVTNRVRWTGLVTLVLAFDAVFLPAWLAGSDLGLTRELAAQLQSFVGWRRPIPLLAALLALLLISWSAGRLVAVFERPRTRSRIELLVAASLCFAIAATSALMLSSRGAIDGREITTKLLALGFQASLLAAAAGRSTAGSIRLARFVFVLCVACGGSSLFALAYVTPSPRDLAGLELEVESEGWTIVAGPLRGRTDIHGVFVLPPGGRRLELLEVRPGPADLFDYRPPQVVDGGLARRVGDADVASIYSDDVDRNVGRGEIRIRSRRFPFLDRPSGFALEDDVVSWAIAPSARYVVATRQVRQPSAPTGSLGYTTEARLPRYRLELLRRGAGRARSVLLDDHQSLLQVIAIDDRGFRVLRWGSDLGLVGRSISRGSAWSRASGIGGGFSFASSYRLSPRYLAVDIYELATGRWIEGPRSSFTVAQELTILPGGQEALVGCSAASLSPNQSGYCRVDLQTLEIRGRTGAVSETGSAVHGKVLPLSGDRLGVLWYLGGNPSRPRRDWRFTTFAPSGRELATVRIGEGEFFSPSRELEDGTLAIARPPTPSPPLRVQVFDWKLESLDLVTGVRRELANGVAPARIRSDETPELFLTGDGRIVMPVASGVHDVTRGRRSEVTPLPSTGRVSVELRGSSAPGPTQRIDVPGT